MYLDNVIFTIPKFIDNDSAWIEHTPFAFFLIKKLKPNLFVELGTHNGISYFSFCQAINQLDIKGKSYAIDIWIGDEHSGYYGNEVFENIKHINSANFSEFSSLLKMTFDNALVRFDNDTIDLLHIDGLHTYDAVKHDFDNWLPKMSEKGVIILHDTKVYKNGFGVWKLMKELKHLYPTMEFNHGHGLGIICVGDNVNKDFLEFVEHANKDSFINNLFANIGHKILLENELKETTQEENHISTEIEKSNSNEITYHNYSDLLEKSEQLKKTTNTLEATINKNELQINKQQQNINRLKLKIDNNRYKKTYYELLIKKITNSYSWQITKPLRLIKNNKLRQRYLLGKNIKIILKNRLFNEEYYLENNEDVKLSGHDPIKHFILHGGYEGRNPGPEFDTKYYQLHNPDIIVSGLNPLLHYILYGAAEGRKIRKNEKSDFFSIKLNLLGVSTQIISAVEELNEDNIEALLDKKYEGKSWPEKGETMIGYKRLSNIEYCLKDIIYNKLEGDVVETGVWRGGACILMKAILRHYNVEDKLVWVVDSFEGLPKPNPLLYPKDADDLLYTYSQLAVPKEEVENNFKKYNLLDDKVRFLKGLFRHTLPDAPIKKISLLRLDGDMYESTMDSLTNLYPKLCIGGYLIIDDWGAINACKEAVLDYRLNHNINEEIIKIDWTGVFWKKEKHIKE